MEFLRQLFSGDGFMPRRLCGTWSESLIQLHVVSDVVIWIAYMWIPLVMLYAYKAQKQSLRIPRPLIALLLLYVTFITACGWTHFMDALMFYQPAYRINGLVRGLTAVVSFMTAVSLLRLIPQAITAPITIVTQQAALKQQHQWLRDILDAATGGVLHLCERTEELPPPAASEGQQVSVRTPADLRAVRQMVEQVSHEVGLSLTQTEDFVSACHEAAMNALVHATGATIMGFVDHAHGRIQVWVEDTGSGIPLDRLPISTLKQGYSTAGTAGQGWFLVLTMVDRAYLLTGRGGTRLVLEISRDPSRPSAIPFSHTVGGDVAPHFGIA